VIRVALLGGSAFLRRLARHSDGAVEVRALVREAAQLAPTPWLTPVLGALPDRLPDELFFDSPHVVVHLATKQRDDDGTGFEETNERGTERVLATMPTSCVGVLYGSSLSVCGQGEKHFVDERAPVRPETALAASRAAVESAVFEEAARRGISGLCFRPRFVLGQGDRFTLRGLQRLYESAATLGDGRQRFSIIDVDDYADVLWRSIGRVLEWTARSEPRRMPVHVAYRRPIAFAEIEGALAQRFGTRRTRWRVPTNAAFCWALRAIPSRSARSAAVKVELFGRPQLADCSALAELVGEDLVDRDPFEVVHRSVRALEDTRATDRARS
jgi:nucleoside-diphosphate-sugar epimerase